MADENTGFNGNTGFDPARPVTDSVFPPRILLHTYEVERMLGGGGMSDVYLARHTVLGTKHAIKVLKPELIATQTMFDVLELFRREAAILRSIRNDAVVGYDGFFQDEKKRYFLVMEYVDGPSLAQVLKQRALLLEEVYLLRDRLLRGLAAVHEKGVIHRDISPDNVILPGGQVANAKLIDFGIAKLGDPAARTVIGDAFAGKLRYVAPEQMGLFGGTVGPWSDIYSLGLVLAAAAIGRPLDMGSSYAAALQARQIVPDSSAVPAELRPQLTAMLQPNPADRPQQVSELLQRWPRSPPVSTRNGSTVVVKPGGRGGVKQRSGKYPVFLLIILGVAVLGWVGLVAFPPWKRELPPPTSTPHSSEVLITGPPQVEKIAPQSPAPPVTPSQQERTPLLMTGKTSLYQRILTRPGTVLRAMPGDRETGRVQPPLSIFFVYDRKQIEGKEWLEVGAASQGPPDGWLPADQAIEWKQTLTVAFTNPADREPALFFQNREDLLGLIQSPHMASDLERVRNRITQGDIPADFPVIAMEPYTFVDPREHFYLLPILNFAEAKLENRYFTRLLNVAAVTLLQGDQDVLGQGRAGAALANTIPLLKNYRAGIVFVVDTTKSMKPYLDRTRDAVYHIYQQLKDSSWGKNISFGLVAFRSNTQVTPGLEYVTQIFATLKDGLDEATFFRNVSQVTDARVSSHSFNEDAYTGIFAALRDIDWSGYDGRFIVLITDAGALEANDPLGQTHLGADQLRILAQEKEGGKIAIYALHLLTPEGHDNHEVAANQYQTLTQWGNAGSLYFGVKTGSVTEFGKQVDALAASLVQQVADASTGRLVAIPAANTASELEQKTAIVGRAMQLAYLGRAGRTEAPRLINAWVADRDLEKPTYKTLDVRVLITKNQLSDLQQTLNAILQAGEQARIKPKDFFAQLRSAAARLARDPENVNERKVQRLADVGLVSEWLADLPYKSKIMEITEDDWLEWSFTQQREFLDEIGEKMILYQKFHDDTDRWVTLDTGRVKGDAVCSIPVDILP